MKFLNSDYSKGYANFAGGRNRSEKAKPNADSKSIRERAVARGNAQESKVVRQNAMARQGRAASTPTPFGPQPLVGPQQKKGFFGKAKDAAAGKRQYYGAKAKNSLSSAGKFIAKNKVGVGLAAAGALGAAGVAMARKMRSDKGKKRGQYSK